MKNKNGEKNKKGKGQRKEARRNEKEKKRIKGCGRKLRRQMDKRERTWSPVWISLLRLSCKTCRENLTGQAFFFLFSSLSLKIKWQDCNLMCQPLQSILWGSLEFELEITDRTKAESLPDTVRWITPTGKATCCSSVQETLKTAAQMKTGKGKEDYTTTAQWESLPLYRPSREKILGNSRLTIGNIKIYCYHNCHNQTHPG